MAWSSLWREPVAVATRCRRPVGLSLSVCGSKREAATRSTANRAAAGTSLRRCNYLRCVRLPSTRIDCSCWCSALGPLCSGASAGFRHRVLRCRSTALSQPAPTSASGSRSAGMSSGEERNWAPAAYPQRPGVSMKRAAVIDGPGHRAARKWRACRLGGYASRFRPGAIVIERADDGRYGGHVPGLPGCEVCGYATARTPGPDWPRPWTCTWRESSRRRKDPRAADPGDYVTVGAA